MIDVGVGLRQVTTFSALRDGFAFIAVEDNSERYKVARYWTGNYFVGGGAQKPRGDGVSFNRGAPADGGSPALLSAAFCSRPEYEIAETGSLSQHQYSQVQLSSMPSITI